MPRRKKLLSDINYPDYDNPGKLIDKLLVQKSNPLQTLSETSMTLSELKILDAYLSRINSHDPEKRYVRFEKGDLEKLLGVTRLLQPELEKRVDNLFQVLTIRDKNKEKGFTKISLFSKAECFQDEKGLWQVDLACSQEAMEYFFNIENLGYLKYRLKNVIELTSRYSYILYLHLESNYIRNEWEISLVELKNMLNCTAERYNQFKFFNAEILKKCHSEINEKTSINFEYKPIRNGRCVTDIKFIITTRITDFPEQVSDISEVDSLSNNIEAEDNYCEIIHKFYYACNCHFSLDNLSKIYSLISTSRIPTRIKGDNPETRQYNYFVQMFAKYKVAEQSSESKGKKIKKPLDYFLKLINNDLQDSTSKKTEEEQTLRKTQSYDINEFEKFAITFSKNTKIVSEDKELSSELFVAYEQKISEMQLAETGYTLLGKISLDKELKDNEKEKLIGDVKEKIRTLS